MICQELPLKHCQTELFDNAKMFISGREKDHVLLSKE